MTTPAEPASTRSPTGFYIAAIVALLLAGAFFPALPRGAQLSVALSMLTAFALSGWWLAPWLRDDSELLFRVTPAATIGFGLMTLLPQTLGHFGVLRTSLFLPAVALVLLAAFAARKRTSPSVRLAEWGRDRELAFIVFTASILLRFFVKQASAMRMAPLGAAGGDDVSYHGTAMAIWNRYGDLRMVKYASGDPSTPFYPIGSELQAWTLLAPFRDCDILARWSQLPFFLASIFVVAAIALRLGASSRSAAVACLVYAAVPRFFPGLALSTGNDCATAFYALAAVEAVLSMRRTPASAAFAGLAVGLLAGTKFVGLMIALPIVLIALILATLDGARRFLSTATTIVLVSVLAGGYTYARNAAVTGNPLFPASVSIGGRVLLEGWVPVGAAGEGKESEIHVWRFLTHQPEILGWISPWALIPTAFVAPVLWFARSRRRDLRGLVLFLPLLIFLQFLHLMLDHRDIRYFMAAIALAAAGLAWLLGRLPARSEAFVRVVLLAILCAELFVALHSWRARVFAVAIATVLTLAAMHRWTGWKTPRLLIPAAVAMAFVVPLFFTPVIQRYQNDKYARLLNHLPESPAAVWIDRATRSEPATIAYSGLNRPYLFFGSTLQNDVAIVPMRLPAEERFYDWNRSASVLIREGRYATWESNLRKVGAGYLFLFRSGDEEVERSWARSHPESFKLEFADAASEIWRVRLD